MDFYSRRIVGYDFFVRTNYGGTRIYDMIVWEYLKFLFKDISCVHNHFLRDGQSTVENINFIAGRIYGFLRYELWGYEIYSR